MWYNIYSERENGVPLHQVLNHKNNILLWKDFFIMMYALNYNYAEVLEELNACKVEPILQIEPDGVYEGLIELWYEDYYFKIYFSKSGKLLDYETFSSEDIFEEYKDVMLE